VKFLNSVQSFNEATTSDTGMTFVVPLAAAAQQCSTLEIGGGGVTPSIPISDLCLVVKAAGGFRRLDRELDADEDQEVGNLNPLSSEMIRNWHKVTPFIPASRFVVYAF
jgi:hypothetical protein